MIFLDFDGVLFDTVDEAYAVSVIASGKYSQISEIDFQGRHYKNFRQLRYLVSPAWNYQYLLKELESEQSLIQIKSNFLERVSVAQEEEYQDFERLFFNTRRTLKEDDFERWSKLNNPFVFLDEIKFLFLDFKDWTYIVTTKDRSTVLELFSREGLKVEEKRVFDHEDYKNFGSKRDIIQSILPQGVPSIFIDDSSRHIRDCSQIEGLKCLQPDWGYVDPGKRGVSYKTIVNEVIQLVGKKCTN